MEKTFCEFFAGIGLVDVALGESGWRCAYANDIDPKKRAMHAGEFGESPHYHLEDVWSTDEVMQRIVGRPQLATASFPCTDMSLAGKRQGLAGSQSGALMGFLEVVARLGERRPALMLLENVPGFLTARGGADFEAALAAVAGLGYWLDSFILDARFFVPQSRERLFVVGYGQELVEALGGAPPLLMRSAESDSLDDPWRRAVERANLLRPQRLRAAMERIELDTGWATVDCGNPRQQAYRLIDFIDVDDEQPWWDEAQVARHAAMMFPRHRSQVDALVDDKTAVTPLTGFRRIRGGQQRLEVRFDGVAGCLRTPRGGSAKQVLLLAGGGRLQMRWMTPREYARLQGAPEFALPENDIAGWFGFGDAVCVPAIRWIDRQMLTPACEALAEAQAPVPMNAS